MVSPDGPLPTEFRLFCAGVNATTHGDLLFDDEAARRVLAAFNAHGTDLMVDLAHDSLSEEARANRDDADDARGWFRLEVREGELWAVGVTWTADGEARLRSRRQRYISPAVQLDEDGRVVEVINVALCSMPATVGAQPLVARRKETIVDEKLVALITKLAGEDAKRVKLSMDPQQVKAALDILESGDGAKALEVLKALIASAAGAEPDATAEEPEPMSENADAPADGGDEDEDDEKMAKLRRGDVEIKRLRAQVDELLAEKAAADADARAELVGELVKLGVELPATAWEGDAEKRVPVKRLRDEALAELRKRVELLRGAKPANAGHAPPPTAEGLTAEQEKRAANMNPAQRARYVELVNKWSK